MKTKISHLGRSTVSVILAVMMLLSTMLVGTVSTANAAGSKTVFLLDKASWGTEYAYCWNGNSDRNHDWPGVEMDVVGKQDGYTIYSYTPTKSYANVIFNNDTGGKQTTDLTYPDDSSDDRMYDNQSGKWVTYSTTKTLTTPVIEWANGDDGYIPPKGKQTLSVTNTSAYESISGVTYELYKGSSSSGTKTATGVTNTTGVFDVTESAYYTVKVSTTDSDYTSPSDESNTLQSYCITPSYYLTGDISGGWQDEHQNDNIVSDYYTGISSNKRIFSKTVEIDKEKYFRLIDGSNQQYKPDGSSNNNDFDVSNSTSYATKKSTTTNDGTNGAFKIPKAGKYIIYVDQSTPSPSVWVEEVTAPKHSVTFKSNNESMGFCNCCF
ncbi:MAG TPA: starch-binding protein [Ruminococcus bromii]|nr:starch-binding protein [Ruminococcus bromii]